MSPLKLTYPLIHGQDKAVFILSGIGTIFISCFKMMSLIIQEFLKNKP